MENTETHLFSDPEYHLVQASTGKRFANYIIDIVFFYFLVFLGSVVYVLLNPASVYSPVEDNPEYNFMETLVIIFALILYYFAVETIFKGKTLGKLITGTRAVNEDGSNITPRAAFLRSLCRVVPFEAFSALGTPSYPWHDKWAKSYVIDEKGSNRPAD
ncbi:MAG: RDD family protein [Chitinophagaceae bacterium]